MKQIIKVLLVLSCPCVVLCTKDEAGFVNDIPDVLITTPQDGSIVKNSIFIKVDASDEIYTIKSIEFYIDGTLVFSDSISPYEYLWEIPYYNSGQHTVFVKAYDESSYIGQSELVTVTVTNSDLTPDLTEPNSGDYTDSSLVELIWDTFPFAEDYYLQVATDAGFNQIILENFVNETHFTVELSPLKKYYWRVSARNVTGAFSYWSEIRTFIVPYLFDRQDFNNLRYGIKISNNGCYIYTAVNQGELSLRLNDDGDILYRNYYQQFDNRYDTYSFVVDVSEKEEVIVSGRDETNGSKAKLVKFDNNGNPTWTKTFSENNNYILTNSFLNNDGIVTCGIMHFTDDGVHYDSTRIWNVLLDNNGSLIWQRFIAADYYSMGYFKVFQTANSDILTVFSKPSQMFTLNLNGDLLWLKELSEEIFPSALLNNNGEIIGAIYNNGRIGVFDPNGNLVEMWRANYTVNCISNTSNFEYLVSTNMYNRITKLNSNGVMEWEREMPSEVWGQGEVSNGDILGVGKLNSKIWIFKLSSTGEPIW